MTASLGIGHLATNKTALQSHRTLQSVPSPEERAELHLVGAEGQLQVHTAPYRGSFSVVLSEALRAAGLGSQVMVVQFLKGGVAQGPNGMVQLCGKLKWLRPEVLSCIAEPARKNFLDKETDETTPEKAIADIWEICREQLLKGDLDQVVLDEIGLAIALGYLTEKDFISTLEKRSKKIDVILTGPSIPPGVMKMADQVTELRCGN